MDKNKFNLCIEVPVSPVDQIERYFLEQIQTKALSSNDRIPSTDELSRRWKVGTKTVQKAMNRLVSRGLLTRSTRRGTFVRPDAERNAIAVLFGPNLMKENRDFYRNLANSLMKEIENRQWQFCLYHSLSATDGTRSAIPPLTEVAPHANMKGVVQVSVPPYHPIHRNPAWRRLPQVVYGGPPDKVSVHYASAGFIESAVATGLQANRKRITYFHLGQPSKSPSEDRDTFIRAMKSRGLSVEPGAVLNAWRHSEVPIEHDSLGYQAMKRFIARYRGTPRWPDALIVSEDVAMKGIAIALAQEGVKVPKELLVVLQANEGVHYCYGIPVVRFEVPHTRIAFELVRILHEKMLGRPVRLPVIVRAQPEHSPQPKEPAFA